ncbi:hypothetical protein ABH908_003938 [Pseudomonas frederiksbergensis]|uniref:Uncharacterized protein n=1 Tax=Pseudomonas frederiksbergensis TaxID=104087 RepID=A0A2S8HDZ9_9PSED|nr:MULTISPECIES: hypothetical protein [Pseudomonas]MBD9621267.1 hypothetical protein [Pseudomonas sp. PDM07]PQP00750.1 hypothetical protein C5612_22690 [Pseudomonas frederiksbergensis]QDV96192.1 hypothetical protein FFH90_018585 [Pseudomonas sp. ATCC 43928]
MKADLDFYDAVCLVKRLYSDAIEGRKFRPEQAFAYVQDETESLLQDGSPGINAVLQTAIYMEGARRGLVLSKDSLYAQEMLELLADIYGKCAVQELIKAGVGGEDLERMKLEMDFVKENFLK